MASLDEVKRDAHRRFPGRASQIDRLVDALAAPHLAGPAAIHIHDPRSPRHAAACVRAVLASIQSRLASVESTTTQQGDAGKRRATSTSTQPALDAVYLPPLLTPTPRTLFRTILTAILRQAAAATGSQDLPATLAMVDDSLDTLAGLLSRAIKLRTRGDASQYRLCLVIEHAGRMRDLWPDHIQQALLHVDKLLKGRGIPPGRVSVLLISTVPWHHFRHPDGGMTLPRPEPIYCPPLSEADAISSLKLDADDLCSAYTRSQSTSSSLHPIRPTHSKSISAAEYKHLYHRYCAVAYSSLCAEVSDIVEMRLLAVAVWHAFFAPVQTGELSAGAFEALVVTARPHFRDVLLRLRTGEVSPAEWTESAASNATSSSQRRLREAQLAKRAGVDVGSNVDNLGMRGEDVLVLGLEEGGAESEEEGVGVGVAARSGAPVRKRRRIAQPTTSAVPPLPTTSALLLVAAFVACYNPSTNDVTRFVREEVLGGPGSRRRKKKGGATAKSRGGAAELGSKTNLGRQQLQGPKGITLERLLSIYQVLLWESDPDTLAEEAQREHTSGPIASASVKVDDDEGRDLVYSEARQARVAEMESHARSAAVFQQIRALLSQRFLLPTTKFDNLTTVSVQINITYEVAQALARQVRLKIEDWLHDWNELF